MHLDRRQIMLAGGSVAAVAGLLPRGAEAFPVALFTVMSAVVGTFASVKAINLYGRLRRVADNTSELIAYTNDVVKQFSGALSNVQELLNRCNNNLSEIKYAIENLPHEIGAKFSEAILRQNSGKLIGHCATLSGYLNSSGSIYENRADIKKLCDQLITDISVINSTNANDLQAVIQIVPAVSTWMQGYTAHYLLVEPSARPTNPWDHPLITGIVLPRINKLLASLQAFEDGRDKLISSAALDPGTVYIFDGKKFIVANKPFLPRYSPGEIDTGYFYAIWPEKTVVPPLHLPPGPSAGPPPINIPAPTDVPNPGDLCFLGPDSLPEHRLWWIAPSMLTLNLARTLDSQPLEAVLRAEAAYRRNLRTALATVNAFDTAAQDWHVFRDKVQTELVNGNRDDWTKMPKLPPPQT